MRPQAMLSRGLSVDAAASPPGVTDRGQQTAARASMLMTNGRCIPLVATSGMAVSSASIPWLA